MSDSAVLKEFLVKLAYQIDGRSEAKFQSGLKGATDAAVGLGKAMVVLSGAVTVAVTKISSDLDQLYFQAARTSSSAQSIRAMGYAISQLGGSYQSASQSLESFSAKIRQNPGYESLVKRLGVVTRANGELRDTPKLMAEVAQKLRAMPYHVAFAYAQELGIDEATLRGMMSGEYQKRVNEFEARARRMGVNLKDASEHGNRFSDAMRSLESTVKLLADLFDQKASPRLVEFVKKFDSFLQGNSKQIIAVFERLVDLVVELAKDFEKLVNFLTPAFQALDDLTQKLTGRSGLVFAIEALIALKLAKWLLGISRAILAVGGAAGTVMGAGALTRLFTLLRIGGATAAAGMLLGGAETPESYEARRQSDPEFKRKTDEVNAGNGGLIGTIKRKWGDWFGSKGSQMPGGASGQFKGKLTAEQAKEMAAGIERSAKELGVDPTDIATAISYETGGTMDPWKRGPTTKWGQHRGLIQWGEPQRAKYGVFENSSISDQMNAVTKYLKDAGVRPGHGLLDIYSAINAGSVGRYGASDAAAGGAPGTVADKVRTMGAHGAALAKLKRLASSGDGAANWPSKMAPGPMPTFSGFGLGYGGLNGAPLGGGIDRSMSMNQNLTINVTGAADPAATASAIQGAQKSVNDGFVRNVQGAVR